MFVMDVFHVTFQVFLLCKSAPKRNNNETKAKHFAGVKSSYANCAMRLHVAKRKHKVILSYFSNVNTFLTF